MEFKEEWLFPNAVVPVDATTTRLLVEQLKTMMATMGQIIVKQQPDPWQGLEQVDIDKAWDWAQKSSPYGVTRIDTFARAVEAKLKEKNT